MRQLHDELRPDPGQPLQLKQFFGSMTTLRPDAVGDAEMTRILASIGIDPAALDPDADDGDRLVILRRALMNPYLVDHANGIGCIDLDLDHLGQRIRPGLAAKRAA